MQRESCKVEDLMTTSVLCLKENDTLEEVTAQMKLANIRHIPVVDHRNHVLGIVSSHDVLKATGDRPEPMSTRVAQFMTRAVSTVMPETPAHEAAALMLERRIGSLPVVNEQDELIGIVTETDFLMVAHQALLGKRVDRRSANH